VKPAICSVLFFFCLAFPLSSSESAAGPAGLAQVRSSVQSGSSDPTHQTTRHVVNIKEVRQDAKDLASIADSIPAQVEQIAKGELPASLAENLRKIERLSKHIRTEVAPN